MRKYTFLSVLFFTIFLSCSLEKIDPRDTFLVVLESERNERAKKVIFDREQIYILGETAEGGTTSNFPFTAVIDRVGRRITTYEAPQEVIDNFDEVDIFDFVKSSNQFFMGGTRRPSEFNDEDRIIICGDGTGQLSNWKREGFGSFNAGFQAFLGLDLFDNDRLLAAGFDAKDAADGKSGLASLTEYDTNCDNPFPVRSFQKAIRNTLEGDLGQFIIRSKNTGNFLLVGTADIRLGAGKDIFIVELDNDLNFLSEINLFPSNTETDRYLLTGVTQDDAGNILLLVGEKNSSDFSDATLSIYEFTGLQSPPIEHAVNINGQSIEGAHLFTTEGGFLVLGNVHRPADSDGIKRGFVAYLDKQFENSKEPKILSGSEDFIFTGGAPVDDDGFVFCGTTKNAGLDKIFLIKADSEGVWEE